MVVLSVSELVAIALAGVIAGAWLLFLIISAVDAAIEKIRSKK